MIVCTPSPGGSCGRRRDRGNGSGRLGLAQSSETPASRCRHPRPPPVHIPLPEVDRGARRGGPPGDQRPPDRSRQRPRLRRAAQPRSRSGTGGGDPLTLCIIDVDDFKEVNDRYGHPAGDEVLLAVAACLTHGSRAFRIGGDEFALILPGLGEGEGRAIAETVVERIANTAFPHGGRVTASAGIASSPSQGADASDLVRRADGALYRAKADGKNCVRSRRSDGDGPELTGQDLRAGLRRTALALARAVSERANAAPRVSVADVAARVARRLGLDAEEAELIRVAGGLNDIGKLASSRRAAREARPARRGGAANRRAASADRVSDPELARSRPGRHLGAPPPRALGRSRIPGAPLGRADPARLEDPVRRRRVRGDDLGSDLAARDAAGGGARRARALCRDAVRPARSWLRSCSEVRGPIRLVS